MKENLFEKIRREEVVLWAGAGLSLYAGFPSGTRLSELIIEKISESDKKLINPNSSLIELTEELVRIHGNSRNHLITILKDLFSIKPSSTVVHDQLRTIPHLKTIVTTNYDSLFENSYKEDGQLILHDDQVPYLNKDISQIFKIHGDLTDPNSVIITKSDYDRFFTQRSDESIIWSVIKERISTNSVLFIGYNLEDSNVSVVFDRITNILDTNRKEYYFVAPNLPQHKISHLISKGIQYINDTAENLINELLSNIKENIIDDLEKSKISSDTFRKFLSYNDLLPELGTKNESYHLKSIKGKDKGSILGKFNLSIKNDSEFISEFNKYIKGEKIGEFVITDDHLLDANFWYGGLKFPDSENIAKLEFKSTPRITTTIDIVFEDGFELNNISIKLYGTVSFIEIHLEMVNALIKVNFDIKNLPNLKFNLNYTHKEECSKTKDEIGLFTLLNKLGKGEKFQVFPESKQPLSKDFPPMEGFLEESGFFLDYFSRLKELENYYKIRFQNYPLSSITDSSYALVQKLEKYMKNKKMEYPWDEEIEMEFIDTEKAKENLKLFRDSEIPVEAINQEPEIIKLHGVEINIGHMKYEFLEPFISNEEEILDGRENIARLRSKSKKVAVSYISELNKADNKH